MNQVLKAIHTYLEQIADTAAEIGAAVEASDLDVPTLTLAKSLVTLDRMAGQLEDVRDSLAGDETAEVVP